MNHLIRALTASDSSIKLSRATLLAETIINAQRALLNHYQGQLTALQHELATLADLAPTQTTQLSVGHPNFDPTRYTNTIHALKLQIREVTINRDEAQATLDQYTATEEPSL